MQGVRQGLQVVMAAGFDRTGRERARRCFAIGDLPERALR